MAPSNRPAEKPGADRKGLRDGLTLIEVVIATTVLAFVLGGFLSAFNMNYRSVVISNNRQLAMHQARKTLEDLMGLAYYNSALSDGSHTLSSNCSYTVSTASKIKNITVTYQWKDVVHKTYANVKLTTSMAETIHR